MFFRNTLYLEKFQFLDLEIKTRFFWPEVEKVMDLPIMLGKDNFVCDFG
jgi:hypothetical protein